MRWDEVLDREIREERLKERDTSCCMHKDGAGCVQSPKTECSKIGEPSTNSLSAKTPRRVSKFKCLLNFDASEIIIDQNYTYTSFTFPFLHFFHK